MPKRSERRATCVKKKKCPSLSIMPGRLSRSRINGVVPKRKVTPGWLLQHEGRVHQTRMQSMSVTVTVVLSRVSSEWISAGKRK
jgi:hypothetical protein